VTKWWDNPTMIVSLDAKRRLTVPAGLAPASPGDYFDARFDAEEDALVFRRLPRKESWLAVLKACPISPDDVPRRRRAAARRRELRAGCSTQTSSANRPSRTAMHGSSPRS